MSDFEIDILIEDPRWQNDLKNIEALAKSALRAAFQQQLKNSDITPFLEISLVLIDDEKGHRLNKQYRNKDNPTNVLSFEGMELDGSRPLLGDIVLSYETVKKEAHDRRLALGDHVAHLLIHGFYHLQGYDHQNLAQAREMESLEIDALRDLGIANPYDKDEVL